MKNKPLLLFCITLFIVWITTRSPLIWSRSSLNNRWYKVLPGDDQLLKANLLAKVEEKLRTLVRKERLNCDFTLAENTDRSHTAYTQNKYDIRLCLENPDENTLFYVALHELAHVCHPELGHGEDFWKLFTTLIQASIKHGLYVYQDFQRNPEAYCGTRIESSPYNCNDCTTYR